MHQPGEAWSYGYSSDLLGCLIEVWSGTDLNTFFQERIFKVLDMSDTGINLPEAKTRRLVMKHTKDKDGNFGVLKLSQRRNRQVFFSGGGGLLSTAVDYAHFLEMMINRGKYKNAQLLKPETVDLMTQNQIGNLFAYEPAFPFMTQKDKFGFGFMVNTEENKGLRVESVGSYGWAGSLNTWYWVDPSKEFYAVLLTQVLPFCSPQSIALLDNFKKAVYKATRF